jgi:hypothetical protein
MVDHLFSMSLKWKTHYNAILFIHPYHLQYTTTYQINMCK